MNQQALQDVLENVRVTRCYAYRTYRFHDSARKRSSASSVPAPSQAWSPSERLGIGNKEFLIDGRLLRPIRFGPYSRRPRRVPSCTTEDPLPPDRPLLSCCGTSLVDRSCRTTRRWAACAASTCSAAASRSTIVVVSPWSASCSVTATSAPLSRSIACSALCAKCVRPSRSSSRPWRQDPGTSSPYWRSSSSACGRSAPHLPVGVLMPEAAARRVRYA